MSYERVIDEQKLTFEELYTLLTQIESYLNPQSITPLSSDPDDLNLLIPGYFLIAIERFARDQSESPRSISANSTNVPAFLAALKQRMFAAEK